MIQSEIGVPRDAREFKAPDDTRPKQDTLDEIREEVSNNIQAELSQTEARLTQQTETFRQDPHILLQLQERATRLRLLKELAADPKLFQHPIISKLIGESFE